eukprot:1383473-Prorocentrum_lima.AAC.1
MERLHRQVCNLVVSGQTNAEGLAAATVLRSTQRKIEETDGAKVAYTLVCLLYTSDAADDM